MQKGHEGTREGLRITEHNHFLQGNTLTFFLTLNQEILHSRAFYTDEEVPQPQPFLTDLLNEAFEEVGWNTIGTYDLLFSFASADKTKWKVDITKTSVQ